MNEPQTLRSRYTASAFSHTLTPQWASSDDQGYLLSLSLDLFLQPTIAKSSVNPRAGIIITRQQRTRARARARARACVKSR